MPDAAWDPQALDQQRVTAWVAQRPPHGLRLLDDTGRPTHGRRSVGVARQDAGTLGQVTNGQGVVSAHAVAQEPTSRAPVQWPVTAHLSLPAAWATAPARRRQVHVPAAVALQTKPALALALGDPARPWGVPCAAVVAAAGDGDTPTVLRGLDARQGASVVGGSRTYGVRLPEEVRVAALRPRPRPRRRGPPQKPRPVPRYAAKAVLDALPADRWPPITWREHDDVVRRNPCVAVRVHGATGGAQCSTQPSARLHGPGGVVARRAFSAGQTRRGPVV